MSFVIFEKTDGKRIAIKLEIITAIEEKMNGTCEIGLGADYSSVKTRFDEAIKLITEAL